MVTAILIDLLFRVYSPRLYIHPLPHFAFPRLIELWLRDTIPRMVRENVYFDYAATTPVDSRVLDAMLPYFSQSFGNPSSVHRWGQQAEAPVEQSRHQVAAILGCAAKEMIFTGCGSESDNLALRGVALAQRERRGATCILTTPVEHHAVLNTARDLSRHYGFRLEFLPVDQYGMVDPSDLGKRLRHDTALVSVIYANNEIGTINPIRELGEICRQHGIPFHTDAVQAASQLPISVDELHVDLLSLGAHKFYGPKGIGALYVRHGTPILPVLTGGNQEYALRAGTHNVPLIVGLATALAITDQERSQHNQRLQVLRDHLIAGVLQRVDDARLTGHPQLRLPNHASFAFIDVDGNLLLAALDLAGFACSSGSACRTGDPTPSEVLTALGLSPAWARSSLRVTLGRPTTAEAVQALLDVLPPTIVRLRALPKEPAS